AGPAEPMPAIAGGSPDADRPPKGSSRCALVVGSGLICAAATIAFGVAPSPLIDWASHAAGSLAATI
ncbi:MAG TPA: hypothetical protein VFY33_04425, partial [Solirubrobacterales bacterium]|nr:hypothetical protein [Solirubrobacterales bacterium]